MSGERKILRGDENGQTLPFSERLPFALFLPAIAPCRPLLIACSAKWVKGIRSARFLIVAGGRRTLRQGAEDGRLTTSWRLREVAEAIESTSRLRDRDFVAGIQSPAMTDTLLIKWLPDAFEEFLL